MPGGGDAGPRAGAAGDQSPVGAEAIPLPLKFKISTADDFPAIFLPKAATNWRLESLS
jgi:hypothetical protein